MEVIEIYAVIGFFALIWCSSKIGFAIENDYLSTEPKEPYEYGPLSNSKGAWIGGGIATTLSIFLFLL